MKTKDDSTETTQQPTTSHLPWSLTALLWLIGLSIVTLVLKVAGLF